MKKGNWMTCMVSEFSKINLTLAKHVFAVGRSEVLVFLYECFVTDQFLTSTYLTIHLRS